MTGDTALTLSGPALLTAWSARGLSHSLRPVKRTQTWRDLEGTLHAASLPGSKYALSVEGSDVRPPAFAALWPGATLTVEPAQALAVTLEPGVDTVTLERDPAVGSVTAETVAGAPHGVTGVSGRTVTVEPHPEGRVTVRYRPVLSMMVTDWSTSLAEWDGKAPWSLSLEEV